MNTDRCWQCFSQNTDAGECSVCGFDNSEFEQESIYLPPGTTLQKQYLIGVPLGRGGFGITYLAFDLNLQIKVAIKEYLPQSIATRSDADTKIRPISKRDEESFQKGLLRFLTEAQQVAQFNRKANIVSVMNFFEANGTAYMVMSYLRGKDLGSYRISKGNLPINEAINLLIPILYALQHLHDKNVFHRDISTQNIIISDNGDPTLIDFGAAKQIVSELSQSLNVVKPGYSPLEQYATSGNIGPWTDIYAFAATMYLLITGELPPQSPERLHKDELKPLSEIPGIDAPEELDQLLLRCLSVRIDDRPKQVSELIETLERILDSDYSSVEELPIDEPPGIVPGGESKTNPPPPAPHSKRWIGLTVTAIVLIAAAAGWFMLNDRKMRSAQRETIFLNKIAALSTKTQAASDSDLGKIEIDFEKLRQEAKSSELADCLDCKKGLKDLESLINNRKKSNTQQTDVNIFGMAQVEEKIEYEIIHNALELIEALKLDKAEELINDATSKIPPSDKQLRDAKRKLGLAYLDIGKHCIDIDKLTDAEIAVGKAESFLGYGDQDLASLRRDLNYKKEYQERIAESKKKAKELLRQIEEEINSGAYHNITQRISTASESLPKSDPDLVRVQNIYENLVSDAIDKMDSVEELIRDGHLDNAETIITEIITIVGTEHDRVKAVQDDLGRAYLKLANEAIDNHRPDDAEPLIEKAKKYYPESDPEYIETLDHIKQERQSIANHQSAQAILAEVDKLIERRFLQDAEEKIASVEGLIDKTEPAYVGTHDRLALAQLKRARALIGVEEIDRARRFIEKASLWLGLEHESVAELIEILNRKQDILSTREEARERLKEIKELINKGDLAQAEERLVWPRIILGSADIDVIDLNQLLCMAKLDRTEKVLGSIEIGEEEVKQEKILVDAEETVAEVSKFIDPSEYIIMRVRLLIAEKRALVKEISTARTNLNLAIDLIKRNEFAKANELILAARKILGDDQAVLDAERLGYRQILASIPTQVKTCPTKSLAVSREILNKASALYAEAKKGLPVNDAEVISVGKVLDRLNKLIDKFDNLYEYLMNHKFDKASETLTELISDCGPQDARIIEAEDKIAYGILELAKEYLANKVDISRVAKLLRKAERYKIAGNIIRSSRKEMINTNNEYKKYISMRSAVFSLLFDKKFDEAVVLINKLDRNLPKDDVNPIWNAYNKVKNGEKLPKVPRLRSHYVDLKIVSLTAGSNGVPEFSFDISENGFLYQITYSTGQPFMERHVIVKNKSFKIIEKQRSAGEYTTVFLYCPANASISKIPPKSQFDVVVSGSGLALIKNSLLPFVVHDWKVQKKMTEQYTTKPEEQGSL